MQIGAITIHNFRSIAEASIQLGNYNLIVGENNAGKTGIITALCAFYEDEGSKFSDKNDFPKFATSDSESWIEIEFYTTDEEQVALKEDYRSSDKILRVRRYFKSAEPNRVKSGQSNIYAYENGILSRSLFYGAKNISQAKLGQVVYIPEVNSTLDTLKLSGPSPLRDVLTFVMKQAVQESKTFGGLQEAFEQFNTSFREESSQDGFSVNNLISEINTEIEQWDIQFGVDVNPIRPEEIIKNLVSHFVEDKRLGGERVDVSAFGQGFQRHLIYTLIRVAAKYTARGTPSKKDFAPDFVLLLFEEPEAFLHPSQQNRLDISLRGLSQADGRQVLATSHSTHFVSKNVEDLTRVIRLHKDGPRSSVFQLSERSLQAILDSNVGLYRCFCEKLNDPSVCEELKKAIRRKHLGDDTPRETNRVEEEALKYSLWIDSERARLVFARQVLVCEGASEKALFDYLLDQIWTDLHDRHVYFLDSLGKFNIHRWIALLSELGLPHSVLIDSDDDEEIHKVVNEFLSQSCTQYTLKMHAFPQDLEAYLGVTQPPRPDLKPLNLIARVKRGEISPNKIKELRQVVDSLLEKSAE